MSNKKHFVRCEDDCLVEGMTKEQIVSAIVEATGNTPTLSEDAFITKIVNQNGGAMKLWIGTNAEYNALTEKDAGTCYIINDAKTPNEAYNIAKEAKELSNQTLVKVNNTLSLNGGVMNGNVCFTDHNGHYWGIGCVEGDKLGFGCVEDPNNAPDIEPMLKIDGNGIAEFLGKSQSLSINSVDHISKATDSGVYRIVAGEGNGMPTNNAYLVLQACYRYDNGSRRYMRIAMNITTYSFYRSGDDGNCNWKSW